MAHLQGMMGDGSAAALQEALELMERAANLGRNLDEVAQYSILRTAL